MSKKGFVETQELAAICRENELSFEALKTQLQLDTLEEINQDLFQLGEFELPKSTSNSSYFDYYSKELTLRQNFASASDKARSAILFREGGVYIDPDVLPKIKDNFSNRLFILKDNENFLKMLRSNDVRGIEFAEQFLAAHHESRLKEEKIQIAAEFFKNLRLTYVESLLDVCAEKELIDPKERERLKKTSYLTLLQWPVQERIESKFKDSKDALLEIQRFKQALRDQLKVDIKELPNEIRKLCAQLGASSLTTLLAPLGAISVPKALGEFR